MPRGQPLLSTAAITSDCQLLQEGSLLAYSVSAAFLLLILPVNKIDAIGGGLKYHCPIFIPKENELKCF